MRDRGILACLVLVVTWFLGACPGSDTTSDAGAGATDSGMHANGDGATPQDDEPARLTALPGGGGGGAGAAGGDAGPDAAVSTSDAGAALDAGPDGSGSGGGACVLDSERCADGAREVCDGTKWVSDPCPADKPTCEGAACVVRGPTMVKVGGFYVDSTEVTVAQYRAFLDAKKGDTSGQPSACAWNDEYYGGALLGSDDWPVTYVDWCDAWAFCDWAGKRLCGALDGGALAAADVLDQTKSEWFLACGGPSGWTHPNQTPDCNSSGGVDTLADVASFPGCEGYKAGLFDLEGNAAEWVDSCDAAVGPTDDCVLLGGSYIDNQSYCTESFEYRRDTTADPFGFRCCGG